MSGRSRRWIWFAVVVVVAAFAVIAITHYRDTVQMPPWSLVTPSSQIETATRMAELGNEGHLDEAIDLGLRSTTGHPGDDFIYQMIARDYFERSFHDKNHSAKWTRLGAEYSEKALAANPTDIANVFNVGVNYMLVGDDLDTGGCEYYRKALAVFDGLAPRLQGEYAESQGRTVQLAAFRKHNDEYRSMLNSSLRRCEPSSGQR